jgi:antitoxin (DNA-binding transcriptional repressor) of toxin-antitoxin stability system
VATLKSMKRIKSVGVKELKNNLSAFLRGVKEGEVVLVTERSNVIAEIRQPTVAEPPADADTAVLDMARDGKLILPRRPKERLTRPRLRLAEGVSRRLLDEDRGEE